MVNLQEIAEQVVQKNLRIGDGDFVLIDAWEHTVPLAEALAAACFRAKAFPTIHFFTDSLYRTVLTDTPESVLRRTPAPRLAALDHVTAMLDISGPKDPSMFEGAPPEKMAAVAEGMRPLAQRERERKIRGAWIALAFATPERARQYGIDHEAWTKSISDALTVDSSELAAVGTRVAAMLRDGRQLRIVGPQTDLTVNLVGRRPHVEDGVVDEQDLAAGNRFVALPAGTVGVAPDEGSANGTITFPVAQLWGKVIPDLKLTFNGGRLTGISARENEQVLRRMYDAASGDKDRLGGLWVGINPRAKTLGWGRMTDWLAEGAISAKLGGNKELGGGLESSFSFTGTITGARVDVDGRVLAEEGRVLV
jgi:aminopeptidase